MEEAKKLFGVVKVDKTEETEKLLVLARRAREDNNSENAEKYYGMVLQEDPNNWEAVFFQIYYRAMQCKIMNISSAAISIVNNIESTMKLISEIPNEAEQNTALDTVIKYSLHIASMFSDAAENHYKKYTSTKGAFGEYFNRMVAIIDIYRILERSIKKYFSNDCAGLLNVQKAENRYISREGVYLDPIYRTSETAGLTNEIKLKDESYTPPALSMPSTTSTSPATSKPSTASTGGCYVATAVYGSYDCPQVWTLRRFRDYTLAETWYGRAFIRTYYAISPTLVKWFGKTDWFKNSVKSLA